MSLHMPNQDAVRYDTRGSASVIVLADGVSSCAKAQEGARITVNAVAETLLADSNFFLNCAEDFVRHLIMERVRYALAKQAEADHEDIKEYASTLSFVLCDDESHRLLSFALGDGLSVWTDGKQCQALALPKRHHDAYGSVTATTTENAAMATCVCFADTKEMKSIALFTDGAWKRMNEGGLLGREYAELIRNSSYLSLGEHLSKNKECRDDSSFISLCFA